MLCEYEITRDPPIMERIHPYSVASKSSNAPHGPSVKICREFPHTKKRTTGHSVSLQATLLHILQSDHLVRPPQLDHFGGIETPRSDFRVPP